MKYSDRLKNILKASSNPVARQMLKNETKTHFTKDLDYLDIAIDNPNYIGFIPKNRIRLFSYKFSRDFKRGDRITLRESSLYYHQCNNSFGTIISIDQEKFFSFLIEWNTSGNVNGYRYKDLSSKKVFGEGRYKDFWNKELRQKHAVMTRAGRVARKIYGNKFTSKEYEAFSIEFYGNNNILCREGKNLILVKGDEIAKWYYEGNYANQKGTLGNSCMKYGKCKEYFGIYTSNPDTVNMLVLLDENGRCLGRAIVWYNVEGLSTDKRITFMDRIYTSNSKDEELFKNYAKDKDWAYKKHQNHTSHKEFLYKGNYYGKELQVTLEKSRFRYYPYLDTFCYLSDGILSNDLNRLHYKWCVIELTATGGNEQSEEWVYGDSDLIYCNLNDTEYSLDDVVWSSYHDTYIPIDYATETDTGDYVWLDYTHEGDYELLSCCPEIAIATRNITTCYLSGKRIHIHCASNVFRQNGEFIYVDKNLYEDQVIYSHYYNHNVLKKDCVCVDGNYIFKDRVEEYKEQRKMLSSMTHNGVIHNGGERTLIIQGTIDT